MRGDDQQQNHIFSYLSPEARVRKDHPLRAIRAMVDEVLSQLSRRFDGMYATVGRPSIAPEKLLRAQLLQMLYSIRSERLLMEEMDYNLLFRWFVGLNADDAVWDATVFTKNRDRLLEADVAQEFLVRVVERARAKGLTSDEHFTVDGTLLEAWAGAKSFQPKDKQPTPPPDDPGNPTVNFRGEQRSNQTHASKTDPDARLARKGEGKESKLSYCGNLLVENRNGLIVDAEVFQANGTAERDAALVMLEKLPGIQPVTVGGDGPARASRAPDAGKCYGTRLWNRRTSDTGVCLLPRREPRCTLRTNPRFQDELSRRRQQTPHNFNRLTHRFTISTRLCTESAQEPL